MINFPVIEDEFKPECFYPYQSRVINRIVEIRDYQENKELVALKKLLLYEFNDKGIKAIDDNKIVFEISIDCFGSTTNLFIGFYDFTLSIGFSVKSNF